MYTLRVKAANSLGTGLEWSPQASTPTGDRPAQPAALTEEEPGSGGSKSTTLKLVWTDPESFGFAIDRYELRFDGTVYSFDGTTTFALFGGLAPGSYHNATLRARNAYGWSGWGDLRSDLQTVASVPDQARPLTFEIVYSSRQITLLWSK